MYSWYPIDNSIVLLLGSKQRMWSVFFHELRMMPVLPDTSQTSSAIFPVMKFWKETRAIPSQELLWHQSKNSNESQFILDYQFSGLSVILLQTKDLKKSLFLATTNYIYQIQRKQKVKPPVFEQNKRTQWNACHCTEKKKQRTIMEKQDCYIEIKE